MLHSPSWSKQSHAPPIKARHTLPLYASCSSLYQGSVRTFATIFWHVLVGKTSFIVELNTLHILIRET